jgi:uncharacterized membrane protein YfhO
MQQGDWVQIRTYAPGEVSADVIALSPKRLVLAETAYPGWRAWVDERPQPRERFQDHFLAGSLPAGGHAVRFRFRPRFLLPGAALSLLGLVIVAALRLRRGRVEFAASVLN